jgi:UDP-arabinose 4-epimerase
MRVLVTGGAGYIGSHACKALAAAGHEPLVYDNLRTGHLWAVKWGLFEHGDICDPVRLDEVMRQHRPEAVMHFAALAYVGESVALPHIYYRTNVGGTLALLHAMRSCGAERIVFSSSCATYGVPSLTPIEESSPQQPVNPYGRSKLMAETILRDHVEAYGFSATALRYFNAAGADPDGELGEEHHPETHLLPIVLQAAAGTRTHIDIYGDDYDTSDGTCIRDYVHVSDLATAHVAALERCRPQTFSALNLGTGQGVSVREVIAATAEVTGRSIATKIGPRRPGDPPALVASSALAEKALDWRPQHPHLRQMIETAWGWMTTDRVREG